MKQRSYRTQTLIKRVVLTMAMVFALPSASFAAEFFAVVESTGRKPFASLDLAVDTRSGIGVNVEFMAFDSVGTFLGQFFVPTSSLGFASTESFGNLFDLSAGQPMLIRARTAQGSVNSAATLNVRSSNGSTTTGVLPLQKLDGSLLGAGKLFSIAIGNFRSARLLITNVTGGDVNVDVFQGTEHAPGQGIYTNPRLPNFGLWRVDLSQNESQSNLVVQTTSGCCLIVQLVIDDGKVIHSFMVPPGA